MSFFGFLREVYREAPYRMILLTLFIILAGFFEGVGFTLFIPLIQIITSQGGSAGQAGGALEQFFLRTGIGDSLITVLLLIMAVVGAKNIFLYCQKLFSARITIDFEVNLKKRVLEAVFASDWRYYLDQKVGTFINAMGKSSHKGALSFQLVSQLCAEAVNIALYCAVGLLLSWQAFLASMATGGVYVIVTRGLMRRSKSLGRQGVDIENSTQSAIVEDFTGIKFIKGNGLEEQRKSKLFDIFDRYGWISYKTEKYAALLGTFPEFAMVGIICLIFFVSFVYFKVPGENLLVLLAILYRFNRRAMATQTLRQRFVNYLPSYEFCADIIKGASANREKSGTEHFPSFHRELVLERAGFSYLSGQPVLKEISINIKKNEFAAFVGKSGGGKTTLLDLITGLLKAGEGSVLVDGRDISDYDIREWRKRVAYVPQQSFLMNGTVAENIRMTNPDVTMEDIKRCARMAHADEFIDHLAKKYDSLVGERGIKLSGGQCQRIVLARALAGNPDILLLDEATSSLDNYSEKVIQQALSELKGRITIIVVAHRLTTIENADTIYVMDEGRVVDRGSMEALKRTSGAFQDIYMVK